MRRTFAALGAGLVAGVGGGLVSLGGGTLLIPLLMGALGLRPQQARGTAMATALVTAVVTVTAYGRAAQVDWRVVLWCGLPALLLTPWAARISHRWSDGRLRRAFGAVLMFGALLLMARDLVHWPGLPAPWDLAWLGLVGVVEGGVAGVTGISGGPVLAPLFVLGLGMPQQLAQGSAMAARLPAVLSGLWENQREGNVCWRLLPGLALGAAVGAWGGSHLALALPEAVLRNLFALGLLLLGGRYLRG